MPLPAERVEVPDPAARSRVLIVEDEEAIRDLVSFHLRVAGYECATAVDGRAALEIASGQAFDVIVLDVVLPSLDGVTLCQAIRRVGPNREVPILFLTARREESDKVVGLESGADDYITKPFSIREFLARIKALMRRPRSTWRAAGTGAGGPVIASLGVTVDPIRRRLTRDGRAVSLTPQEFSLLYLLASNPGVVFDRDELLTRIWNNGAFVADRGVDTLVKRLRQKVETDPSRPVRVVTVRGVGYKFGGG
jgi:DNA-binding response OmpR family regulator